jgi:hypothetical protein
LFSHRADTQRTEAYASASSLAAASLDGHFEHPVSRSYDMTIHKMAVSFGQKLSFSAAC